MLQSTRMRMFNLTGKEKSTLQSNQNSLSLCFCDRKPPSTTFETFIQKIQSLGLLWLRALKNNGGAWPAGLNIEGREGKGLQI